MISVVVLAYGEEPYLVDCVRSVLEGTADPFELVLVDNGSAAVPRVPADPRVRLVRPGRNLGFSGGCNAAARVAGGDVLVLLNSDASVAPGAVERLAGVLTDPSVALSSGGIRLADAPELMNSVGNPVHFLGLVWSGGYGEPAAAYPCRTEVTTASGAFLAVRRDVWDELGGFPEEYFAYHEDTELSLRARLAGCRIVFEPAAIAWHHYQFKRNPTKQYLLERNRWQTVLTVYPGPVLAAALPAMFAFEIPLFALAVTQGWAQQKIQGWWWLARHVGGIRRRRRSVQATARLSASAFADLLVARLEPAVLGRIPGLGVVNAVLAAYWRVARLLLVR